MSASTEAVQAWLRDVVIGEGLCPWARRPFERGLVHIIEVQGGEEQARSALLAEAAALDAAGEGTTLLVLPEAPAAFEAFQGWFHRAEDTLSAAGFDRRVQVMGFHPAWIIDGAPDAVHRVQRSPVAVLHLLRWAEVRAAVG